MACPGGCLNGGGQLDPTAAASRAERLVNLEALMHQAPVLAARPADGPPDSRWAVEYHSLANPSEPTASSFKW